MNNPIQQVISEDEAKVLEIEGRRVAAEAGLTAASETTKILSDKAQGFTDSIENSKGILEVLDINITEATNKLQGIETLITEVAGQLTDLQTEKSKDEEDLKEYTITATAEKTKLDIDYLEHKKELDAQKQSTIDEIAALEKSREVVRVEVADATIALQKLEEEEEDHTIAIQGLEGKIASLTADLEKNETSVSQFQKQESDLKQSIEEKNAEVIDLGVTIGSKNNEILELDQKIESKTTEYKAAENKLFRITDREEKLQAKEEFIKVKYERAGVTWEE